MTNDTTKTEERITVALSDIHTDTLPRDRLALDDHAQAVEMMELKNAIRAHGQGAPIEVMRDAEGRLHLLTGWRRLTALAQLNRETPGDVFAKVKALVRPLTEGLPLYVHIAESNQHRANLTLAEMANLARLAAADPSVPGDDAKALINDLYATLHKSTRSFIRAFITLMDGLGDALCWPRAVPRDLGVEVARMLDNPARLASLKAALGTCDTAAAQNRTLSRFAEREVLTTEPKPKALTFKIGDTRVTARAGELRLTSRTDFASLPRHQLTAAIRAFEKIAAQPGWVRAL